ncbi:MAG: transposase [Pirellulaceae bacterium]
MDAGGEAGRGSTNSGELLAKMRPVAREQLVLIPTALEELIPADHPVRLVDEILDRLDWTPWEAAYHGSHGQPPIHPSVLAKTLLFAMIRRIRSSRQMEYELKHSIDFMWLTSGRRIDHTTLSEFRRRHSQELRGIFRQMIQLAINLKIANLAELCIDGTRVLANANRYKTWTSERLARALEQLDSQIVEALATLEANDSLDEDLLGEDISADRLPTAVASTRTRREQLAALMETTKNAWMRCVKLMVARGRLNREDRPDSRLAEQEGGSCTGELHADGHDRDRLWDDCDGGRGDRQCRARSVGFHHRRDANRTLMWK